MHFHIHWLIHTIRHARQLGVTLRLLGTMLLMLVFSVLQLGTGEPDPALTGSKESRRSEINVSRSHSLVTAVPAAGSASGAHRADTGQALNPRVHEGIFSRLQPGIFLIPRKDRLPKPKSVYRIFTRAPGGNSVSSNEASVCA